MSKTAYIIISDLHASYRNIENRNNYLGEIDYVISRIISLGTDYKDRGYKVVLLFLGDIADRSFKEMDRGIWLNNIFVKLRMLFDNIYSVIGNHEFTYYKDNPFWTLMSRIDSKEIVGSINKVWQPRGELQLVNIVDQLIDGEVVFNFNHHPTRIVQPIPNKINIGLFHKNLVPKAIAEQMKKEKGLDIWEGMLEEFVNTRLLDGYNYCFMGHVHKIYGKWKFKNDQSGWEALLYYLASNGRPNHSEVQDNFLERNMPTVLVEDGKFIEIEDNIFNLPSRGMSVKEEVVKAQQETYQAVKKKKQFYEEQIYSDDPIENIRSTLASEPKLLMEFDEWVLGKRDVRIRNLLSKAEEINGYN